MNNNIIGRAACKECGTIIEEEVEKNIECPGCSRIFQIPNAPQYTQQASLSSIRSRSVARLGGGLGINRLFNTTLGESAEGARWEIPKASRQKTRSPKIQVPIFPERGEAQIFLEENWLWVIAEYYGHSSLDQIQRIVANQTLTIKSILPLCFYKDIIEGLGAFTKIFEENIRNGILEIKLKE